MHVKGSTLAHIVYHYQIVYCMVNSILCIGNNARLSGEQDVPKATSLWGLERGGGGRQGGLPV